MRRHPLKALAQALASVRLAVITMAALGIACIAATLYEARRGTAAAQRDFYGTGWFAFLLGLLGLNVLLSMTKRYPWNRHHTGFVLAHVGILLLLSGSFVSLHAGLEGHLVLSEGGTSDRIGLTAEALHVALPVEGLDAAFPVAFAERTDLPWPERFPLPGGSLVVEGFRPHVVVSESWAEGTRSNPALHFTVAGDGVQEHGWLLAADAAQSHVDFGPVLLGFHVATTRGEAEAMRRHLHEGNHFCFVLAPGGELQYAFSTKKGLVRSGAATVGGPIPTPWMRLTLTADRLLTKAEAVRVVAPAPLPEGDEPRRPAIKVRIEGAARSEWVAWEDTRTLPLAGREVSVSYGPRETRLPFRVTLLEFRSDKYPGSNRPATYQSRVRVDDPEGGPSEHVISMNHPLHYRGYTFFQSSFVEGEPMTSILSVARSPGLPLVYLGTVLIGVGVLWMFYVKPLLARRQGRRALEARAGGSPRPTRRPLPARGRA